MAHVSFGTALGTKLWLNDLDSTIATLWRAIRDQPTELASRVEGHVCTKESLDEMRDSLKDKDFLTTADPLDIAFVRLVIGSMMYAGISHRNVGRRPLSEWCPAHRIKLIGQASQYLAHATITEDDFSIPFDSPGDCAFYVDPPYFKAGPRLYRYSMSMDDHIRLSELLRHETRPWLLSYDDCPEIRKLYHWANVSVRDLPYRLQRREPVGELLISANNQ